jgi:hypothetical protein
VKSVGFRVWSAGAAACVPARYHQPSQPAPTDITGVGFRVQGSGFRVQGLGFRVQGVGFRVWSAGAAACVPARYHQPSQPAPTDITGVGFRVQGSGFRV